MPTPLFGVSRQLAGLRCALLCGPACFNCLAAATDGQSVGRAAGAALAGLTAVMTAEEVGLGIVPDNALARAFRDHAGSLHQRMAALANRVVFMVAGLPVEVK